MGGSRENIQIFKSRDELRKYTKETGKYFPKQSAVDGGVLRALRRDILTLEAAVLLALCRFILTSPDGAVLRSLCRNILKAPDDTVLHAVRNILTQRDSYRDVRTRLAKLEL